jgi:hypothetical protein
MNQQELDDIVLVQNHEHLKLLINEGIKNEYDGLRQHLHELSQLMTHNILS